MSTRFFNAVSVAFCAALTYALVCLIFRTRVQFLAAPSIRQRTAAYYRVSCCISYHMAKSPPSRMSRSVFCRVYTPSCWSRTGRETSNPKLKWRSLLWASFQTWALQCIWPTEAKLYHCF